MKKILLSTSLLLSLSVFATEPNGLAKSFDGRSHVSIFAQDSSITPIAAATRRTSRSVIKLNLTPIALGVYSLQYEFGFHKNMSGALGFSLFRLPGYVTSKVASDTSGISNLSMGGFTITPEFRFYPGKKVEHQAPHGFYLAPYFRYSKTTVKGDYTVDLPDANNPNVDVPTPMNLKTTYSGYTVGLMIGKQWIIGKHFSIDWWMLGGGYGRAKFKTELSSDGLNLSPNEQAVMQDQLDASMKDISVPGFNVTATSSTNAHGADMTIAGLPMMSIRAFGLCLGFAF